MDGHFVPNISYGPDVIKALRPHTKKVFDAHLMIAGGQAFIPSALGKIRDLRAMTLGREIDIEVDGEVAPDVAGELAAGANAFVAGPAVFKGGTKQAYKANIDAIRLPTAAARGEAV
jgi:ribulose-phosphate 3-epimerase